MVNNPLFQYFRQPKIYIPLPSGGKYNKPGTIQGDPSNLSIFGMTGMDEILMKTPDALMTGESTVRVLESCCSAIKDGWDVSILDINILLIAIRIATFGDNLSVIQTCKSCKTENEYDIKLSTLIEHYSRFTYDSKLVLKDLVINIRPLSYQESTEFSIKNFEIQQKISQIDAVTDAAEKNALVANLFQELGELQKELFIQSIDSVEVNNTKVQEKSYIVEWLTNCDQEYYESIKSHINMTKDSIQIPPYTVQCSECNANNQVIIDLDESNFFEKA